MSHFRVRHHCTRFFHVFQSNAAHPVEVRLLLREGVAILPCNRGFESVIYKDSEKAAFDVVLIKEKDLFSTEGICADVYIFRAL